MRKLRLHGSVSVVFVCECVCLRERAIVCACMRKISEKSSERKRGQERMLWMSATNDELFKQALSALSLSLSLSL